jgi:RNA polymerase sigma-70 factor, ECF subfamily
MVRQDISEEQLIRHARQGDTDAFEVLVHRYERYVFNLAYRVLGDAAEADDLAQAAFYQAWRGLAGFRQQARFSTWLYRIATNLCYNRLPGLRADLTALVPDEEALDLPDERQEVERVILTEELRQILYQAIEDLPEGYRLLVTLRHLQELSYEEIAQVTALPLGTVKTGIFRARRLLREALEKADIFYEPG